MSSKEALALEAAEKEAREAQEKAEELRLEMGPARTPVMIRVDYATGIPQDFGYAGPAESTSSSPLNLKENSFKARQEARRRARQPRPVEDPKVLSLP